MSDDNNLVIDRRIDRNLAGAMLVAHQGGGSVIAPRSVGEVMEFAKMMAISGVCVRPVFRGNPGACLAIAMQAMKWGADPFAVANKAYVVKNKAGDEQIAYEAQLVHAIVNSSPVLKQRLRPVYEGQAGERKCRIVGHVTGEAEPLEYESPPIKNITVKNSPLWQSDPDQQLFYYSVRAWARRHVPEVLLGIYTPEEFTGETIDHAPGPEPRREDFQPIAPSASASVTEAISEDTSSGEDTGASFDLVDLDGVVTAYAAPLDAANALYKLMEQAARFGAERLSGLWEDNQGIVAGLGQRWRDQMVIDYADLLSEAEDREKRSADRRYQQQPPNPASSPVGSAEAATPPPASESDKPAPPAPPAPPPAPPAPEQSSQQSDPAQAAKRPEPADSRSSGPARGASSESRAQAGPTDAPQTPEGLYQAPPLKDGKPIWRTWWKALMAPKVRRQTTNTGLADLLGANEEGIEACRNGGLDRADLADMNKTIADQWKRTDPHS